MTARTSPPTATATTVARTSVGGLLRQAVRLDRTQSDPVVALRNAVGVAAPLAVGIAVGNAPAGLAATIGALQVAFADRPGPYRLRVARMLTTGAAAAVTSLLAVALSRSAGGSVVLLAVLGLLAGLLLSAGPAATQIGTAGVAAALVLGHIPQQPSTAPGVAVLVFAGGVVQTLLAVSAWPLRRHRPERLALAALYRDLAAAARLPSGSRVGPPAGESLAAARQTLFGLGHDHGPSVEAYRVLLDEADRVRRELVVVAALADRLAEERNPILCGFVRESLTAAGSVLDEVAGSLDAARPVRPEVLDRARATIRFAVDRLQPADEAPRQGPGEPTRRAVAGRLQALGGQLRAAVEGTLAGSTEGRRAEEADSRGRHVLRDPLAILRANLTPDSAVRRHAVRVAVLVPASDLVARLVGFERGYWVALTVLVVLRPDFGSTLQRAVMRTLGTVVGLVVASELVHWVPGGQVWPVVLIAAFTFGMRFAGPGNIGLSAVSLSGLVVVLLALDGVAPHATLVDRSVSTAIGGVLAVTAVLLAPSWERTRLPAQLAALLQAYRDYLLAVAELDSGRETMQRTRAGARRARTTAQASVDRASAEPVPARREVELGRTVLTHTHRLVHALLTIDALRPALREAHARSPELAGFLAAAAESLDAVRVALVAGAAPRRTARLRPRYEALATALDAVPDVVGGPVTAAALLEAADRITNSLDTLTGVLRRWAEDTEAAPAAGDRAAAADRGGAGEPSRPDAAGG